MDDRAKFRREVGPDGGQRRRLLADVLQRDLEGVAAAERRVAGEHLIAGDAERVDVAAVIDGLALDLLGAHEQRRAHRGAGRREIDGLVRGEAARQAEVGHLRLALPGQQDVLRLDVAVDDPQLAGLVQGGRHLPHDAQGEGHVERPLAAR